MRARSRREDLPPARPCDRCDGAMTPGQRFEATGKGCVSVLICWDCGFDDPPLYPRRSAAPSPIALAEPRAALCGWCDMPFAGTTVPHPSCNDNIAARQIRVRQVGRVLRKRIVS